MGSKILKNKPLVEAIFELRWEIQETIPGIKIDPHYQLLIGRVYDRVKEEYSFHEPLPTSAMPEQIAGYIVQHRFRKEKDQWPLIQLGPGIITLNDTEGYKWNDFKKRIENLIDVIYDIYPNRESNFKINNLMLRYINAIDFDYEKEDLFMFLKDKLKVSIEINKEFFQDESVINLPVNIDSIFSFTSNKPRGIFHLRFVRGKKKNLDALIWETILQSIGDEVPNNKEKILQWAEEAHSLIEQWFFRMIEGELLRRFE
jgi:uncharacterized protein (TIGR04255 family)